MTADKKNAAKQPFPTIQQDMLGRLADEADLRTLPPQDMDWDDIHRQAAEVRKKK